MRNKRKILLLAVFLGCCALFAVYYFATRGMGDTQPPEIILPKTEMSVSVHAGDEELLRDVKAVDAVDGDVSDSLVIEKKADIFRKNHVMVTYAAFDSAGNVAKAEREIILEDYVKPRFTLSAPLIFREGGKIDVFEKVGASDTVDGELDDWIKCNLVSDQPEVEKVGSYMVEFRVTNSLGDTAKLTIPVEVQSANTSDRRLDLTQYLVYLKQGADFDPMSYVDQDSRSRVGDIESGVNMDVPGTYTVTFHPKSRETIEKTRLTVIVEE